MRQQELVDIRRQAEKAVSEMSDGELKMKAFEVILSHLLQAQDPTPGADSASSAMAVPRAKRQRSKGLVTASSKIDRIRLLKNDGFFGELRTIGEVRKELAARGWHYPLTALSGPLQELVQRRELRRQKMPEGKRTVWKYCNP